MNAGYFIEDLRSSSEDEGFGHRDWTRHRVARIDSPPAILAFSITSGRVQHKSQSPEPAPSGVDAESTVEDQGESSDWSVEEWMILDQASDEEDSTIQLNLSFSNSSSEEDTDRKDGDDEDEDDSSLLQDSWAVSKRDKETEKVSVCRYFSPGQTLICHICMKMGHTAKSCQIQRKCPVCVLCGIQGHLQRECPSRPCSRCGLLAHGARACDRPPVWHQHCQRCGVIGHLSDICPDTWRQFHQTIKMTKVPIWNHTRQTLRKKKRRANCYNCSKRGHFGHECRLKRMISGTFFTLPYVCFYDDTEKVQNDSRLCKINMGNASKTLPSEQRECIKSFGEYKEQLLQRNSKLKQKAQAAVRKTWPERRRERQQVKRLRREAQARRESGLFGQWFDKPDDWQNKNPLKKINKTAVCNRRREMHRDGTRRSKQKKAGESKHGLLHHHKDTDLSTENILSLKERVRHRRR